MAGAVSLDGLEEAHSFIDLVRYGAQDVFQRPGPLVQLLELWLSPVNHELWKNTVRQEEKKKIQIVKLTGWQVRQHTCK